MRHVLIADYRPTWFDWKSESSPYYMKRGTMDGLPAWTDAHVMCLGEPPVPIEDNYDFTSVVAMGKRATLTPVKPLGVIEAEGRTVLVFETGIFIQVKFFNLIRERWPDVEWFGDGRDKSVAAHSEGKLVALVMPIKMDDPEFLLDTLQSANAGNLQTVTDTPEERQKQKSEETEKVP
jgi:hypothetical protein